MYIHKAPIRIAAVRNLRDTKAVGRITTIGIVIAIIIIVGIASYCYTMPTTKLRETQINIVVLYI